MPKDIDYDSEYRRLFSFPRLIEDLLRGFFASEKWTERLNYDSLESMSGSTVSEALDQRHQDMVWAYQNERQLDVCDCGAGVSKDRGLENGASLS